MKLEKMLCNGNYVDIDETRVDEFIGLASQLKQRVQGEWEKMDREQIITALESGRELRIGTDWYDSIRVKPTPRPVVPIEMVTCDCGHTVPRSQVMSASLGTSCPDCYDRMSA